MTINLQIRGSAVRIMSQKLVYLADISTLLVADTHFGKAATFRRAGIPVPGGTTQNMLDKLTKQIDKTQAQRLIVLGDFVHSVTRAELDFEADLVRWRKRHRDLNLILVAGNHDRGNDSLFKRLRIKVVKEPFCEPPFAFCHYAEANNEPDLFTFAGHLHPALRLGRHEGAAGKIPCFAISEQVAVLPAFGEFTGTTIVSATEYPYIYAVADGEVIEIK